MTYKIENRLDDVSVLHYIHKFNWMRSVELGRLFWPASGVSRQRADGWLRRLHKQGFLIQRLLPSKAGNAYVLSKQGAEYLSKQRKYKGKFKPKSGKDLGTLTDKFWNPGLTWRHDLIAQGVLIDAEIKGYKTYSEKETNGWKIDIPKQPDGLIVIPAEGSDAEYVIWLEVENARKSGKNMRVLAEAVIFANQKIKIGNYVTDIAAIAFDENSLNEAGHRIDHKQRVSNAVATKAKAPVPIYWLNAKTRGPGVYYVEYSKDEIADETWRRVADQIEQKYEDTPSGLQAHYWHYFIRIDKNIVYVTNIETDVMNWVKDCKNLSEAKRYAAMYVHYGLPSERERFEAQELRFDRSKPAKETKSAPEPAEPVKKGWRRRILGF